MSKYLCPFCIKEVDTLDRVCKCENCNKEIEVELKEPSAISSKLFGERQQLHVCSKCGTTLTFFCPNPECGKRVPRFIETNADIIIGVVGPKGVGKSQYITVLINLLESELTREFGLTLTSATDETTKIFDNNYRTLYDRLEVIPETLQLAANVELGGEPQIFYLNKARSILGNKSVTLIFYDTAGEDLHDMKNIMSTKISRYLAHATGIIYLVDPLQTETVRRRLILNGTLPEMGDDVTGNLNLISRIIRETRGIKPNEMINTKLAVVLTKCDVLMKEAGAGESEIVFDTNSSIHVPRKQSVYDEDNIRLVSKEVEEYIHLITRGRFAQHVTGNYRSHMYFMASALGQNPNGPKLNHEPTPFRVEDPMIWLLKETNSGAISGTILKR